MVKEAEDVNNVDWPNYFALNSVSMPAGRAYWHKQKIDVQPWKSEIIPLERLCR